MARIVIVYHSGYGHTAKIAEAIAHSAGAALVPIDAEGNVAEAGWEQLHAADMIVFGSPTYMGMASWQFKKFADATSKAWFTRAWQDKLFAGFSNSASMYGDKGSTIGYFMTLAMQQGGLWVGTGMLPSNAKAHTRADVNFIGAASGLMTATPSDASTDEMQPGDLATAAKFGERLATVARAIKG